MPPLTVPPLTTPPLTTPPLSLLAMVSRILPPSLPTIFSRKVMNVFIKAAEYMEIPVRRNDVYCFEKVSAEFANIVDVSLETAVGALLEDIKAQLGEDHLLSGMPLAKFFPRIAQISPVLFEEPCNKRYLRSYTWRFSQVLLKGSWEKFLSIYDKQFGATFSDPAKRSVDALVSFLKTFSQEDDFKFFKKLMYRHSTLEELKDNSKEVESP